MTGDTSQIYRFKLGDFACIAIQDEAGGPTPQQAFPSATDDELKTVAQRFGFALDKPLALSFNLLLVDTGTQKILLDTGNGVDTGGDGRLFDHLAVLGIAPDSIDVVVITHAHADHYAGILSNVGTLNFPNARHYIWRDEWTFYTSDEQLAADRERGQERYDFIKTYFLPVGPHWHYLDAAHTEIVPGITAVYAPGHTRHHIAVRVESAGEVLYFVADAFIHPAYVEYPQWVFPVDIDGDVAVETRRALTAQIAEEKALMLGYHFAFPGLARVYADDNGFTCEVEAITA